jgi:hypothetical protein
MARPAGMPLKKLIFVFFFPVLVVFAFFLQRRPAFHNEYNFAFGRLFFVMSGEAGKGTTAGFFKLLG